MKIFIFGLFLWVSTTQLYSQIIQLPEIEIITVNYKYLNAMDTQDMATPVKKLQEIVAVYDLKNPELYSDEYNEYFITFFIPDGKIAAAYDKDGKIIRTIEKFKNIKLPVPVRKSIAKRFPNWVMAKNVYQVNYHKEEGLTKMLYKVRLENGKESLKIKIDAGGNFL